MGWKIGGNDMTRCPICNDVFEEGALIDRHYTSDHGFWEKLWWRWDSGYRGIPLFLLFWAVVILSLPITLLRTLLGI